MLEFKYITTKEGTNKLKENQSKLLYINHLKNLIKKN